MAVKSIDSSSSFDLMSRQRTPNREPKLAKSTAEQGDTVTLRSTRGDSPNPLRNIDDALNLASSLRAGILADHTSALNVRANDESNGLAELLSH